MRKDWELFGAFAKDESSVTSPQPRAGLYTHGIPVVIGIWRPANHLATRGLIGVHYPVGSLGLCANRGYYPPVTGGYTASVIGTGACGDWR